LQIAEVIEILLILQMVGIIIKPALRALPVMEMGKQLRNCI